MSDYELDLPITSPTLATPGEEVRSVTDFSNALTLDLTDEEITKAMSITIPIASKYQQKFRAKLGPHVSFTLEEAMKLVDEFEDEIKTRLAEDMDLLAHVDVEPVFEGKGPAITFVGALPSHSSAKYGLDHEKKEWEVKKAKEQSQPFLGADKLE